MSKKALKDQRDRTLSEITNLQSEVRVRHERIKQWAYEYLGVEAGEDVVAVSDAPRSRGQEFVARISHVKWDREEPEAVLCRVAKDGSAIMRARSVRSWRKKEPGE